MYIVLCIHQFYHCSWNVSEFFSFLEKKLETKANIIIIHQITPIWGNTETEFITIWTVLWAELPHFILMSTASNENYIFS